MPTFNASEIIGKTLFAKSDVNIVNASGVVLGKVKAGNPIGTVYSWITDKSNGDILWMFYDSSQNPYYVRHKEGLFDVKELREQGVMTTKEREDQAKEDAKPWYQKLGEKAGKTFITIVIVFAVVAGIIYAAKSGVFKKK